MRKSIMLAYANIRKAKGQAAAIAVLMLLAALMLNLWLILAMDYRQNFDRWHQRLNEGHVTLAADGGEEVRDFLTRTLEKGEGVEAFSMDDALHMVGSFSYNEGEINAEFVFLEKENALSRSVGRVEIVEEGNFTSGVYMPIIYRSEDITVGETIRISIGSNEVDYTVCGFFNSAMAGSHNCSLCGILLTEDKYEELKAAGCVPEAVFCSVRLKNVLESENYEAMLKNEMASVYPAVRMVSNSYALVSQSRYIAQMICSGIMSAMAFFILLIALIVTASNIMNYIQRNMKSIGALKAVGYTSRQLMSSLLMQFLVLSLTAAVVGIGIAYLLFPYVNTMMTAQTGIPYTVHFLPKIMVFALSMLAGTVVVIVWLSARRIRKIEPITALRQGIQTHSFRRNHVPLGQTKAPLHLALALKTTLAGVKQNITIGITMLVLSLVIVFSGLMVKNVIIDMTPFIDMVAGETADSCINISAETEEEFLQAMYADGCVEKVYLYSSVEVRHVDGVALLATCSDDFSMLNNQGVVFEGRFPKYDNEIAIAAKYAAEQKLEIGDEIIITADGGEASYLISGFTQISNNLGKDCLLTREGYERLGELPHMSYYLNLSERTDVEAFQAEVKEDFGAGVNAAINIQSVIIAGSSVYVSLMTVIVAAAMILSVAVVVFVLYLLVRTLLGGKEQEYGILKAVGFTTGQLILQTALSFMPAVILSTAAGILVSSYFINPLTALFLRGIGIVRSTFALSVGFNIFAGIALVLFTFLAVCVLSLRIRKITPRALLAGE